MSDTMGDIQQRRSDVQIHWITLASDPASPDEWAVIALTRSDDVVFLKQLVLDKQTARRTAAAVAEALGFEEDGEDTWGATR